MSANLPCKIVNGIRSDIGVEALVVKIGIIDIMGTVVTTRLRRIKVDMIATDISVRVTMSLGICGISTNNQTKISAPLTT